MATQKEDQKIGFQDRLLLNAGQKYCRMLQESILQYFRPSLSYHLSLRPLFWLFLSGHLKQVLFNRDACLTAIPGVASSIQARSHTFVEIYREIISTVILLPSADSFKKGCCQLQAKVCARITGYPLVQACPGKSVVR